MGWAIRAAGRYALVQETDLGAIIAMERDWRLVQVEKDQVLEHGHYHRPRGVVAGSWLSAQAALHLPRY